MAERVALIPGGARGIGRAIALAMASDGWTVVLAYRTSKADAERTADELVERAGRGESIQCDVSDPRRAADLVQGVEAA